MVVKAFSDVSLVPWKLRNKWKICLKIIKHMYFRVSYIFREGISWADKLVVDGITLQDLV